jgi:hypothetical protein
VSLSCPKTLRLCTAAALCATTLLGSDPAYADEPVREVRRDANAYPTPSTRLPTFVVGAITTATWYGLSFGGALLYPTARGADELKVPIVGPWMSLAKTGCPETTPDCSTFWMVVAAIAKGLDGIGQAGGLLIMAEGLLMPTLQPPSSSAAASPKSTSRASSVLIHPTALPGGLGIGVAGLF